MKQTTRIICITLCVLLIALSAAGVIWALYNKFASNEAHAEYTDLAGTDTLVNFNQILYLDSAASSNYSLVNNYTIKLVGSSSTGVKANITSHQFSFQYGNKYYLMGNSGFTLYFSNGGSFPFNAIYDFTNNNNWNNILCTGIYANDLSLIESNVNYSFSVFNLTTMFGAGNEPNLEQAQEYFTADYYNYTTGTTIPYGLDYLEGYQKGIQDFQNSLTATFNNDILGTLSFAANIAGFESTIGYDANLSRYLVNGLAGFRLGNSISSPINFKADMFIPNYSGGLYLAIFNYTDNGTLLPLWVGEVQDGTNLDTIDANFNIVNIDTLYFGLFSSQTQFTPETNTSAYFVNTELTIYNIDVAALVNSAIGQTKSAYMEGGVEYEAIYNKGYLRGIAEQNATLGTMEYIGAAFSGIGSILAIELLPGVPFSLFILLPLMFGLIAFVVKLSKGGD